MGQEVGCSDNNSVCNIEVRIVMVLLYNLNNEFVYTGVSALELLLHKTS